MGFGDELGLHELAQVLADRVVVETEILRELGNVDGAFRIRDVAKDAVPSGITQRPGLLLERCVHASPFPIFSIVP